MLGLSDLVILKEPFRKLLTFLGIKDGIYVLEDFLPNTELVDPQNIYVVAGSNSAFADGSLNAPFGSINDAIKYLKNFRINTRVNIVLSNSNFNETINFGGFDTAPENPEAEVVLLGQRTIDFTGTGVALTEKTFQDVTQNWQEDQLIGGFLVMVQDGVEKSWVITRNTTDTLTLAIDEDDWTYQIQNGDYSVESIGNSIEEITVSSNDRKRLKNIRTNYVDQKENSVIHLDHCRFGSLGTEQGSISKIYYCHTRVRQHSFFKIYF